MAWLCVRCGKKIFAPRANSKSFVMEWKYQNNELLVDVCKLAQVTEGAVISHLACDDPPYGFNRRLRYVLKIPANMVHPLLD